MFCDLSDLTLQLMQKILKPPLQRKMFRVHQSDSNSSLSLVSTNDKDIFLY